MTHGRRRGGREVLDVDEACVKGDLEGGGLKCGKVGESIR